MYTREYLMLVFDGNGFVCLTLRVPWYHEVWLKEPVRHKFLDMSSCNDVITKFQGKISIPEPGIRHPGDHQHQQVAFLDILL